MISEKEILEKVNKYELLTKKGIEKIKFTKNLNDEKKKIAEDFLSMANNYFNDGVFFKEKGDFLTALASFSYAHAWLDAGVRSKLFFATDDQLFTLP
jgi:uncharacterized protein